MELIALCAKSRKDMLNISPAANPYNTYKIKIYLTTKEKEINSQIQGLYAYLET